MIVKEKKVVVLIGAGAIGQAIVRRIGAGTPILLADINPENLQSASKNLSDAGYEVSCTKVDVCSRTSVQELVETAQKIGKITHLIHTAGVSPSQATATTILKADLYGTALVLELFGKSIASGGSGVIIGSQSGYRLAPLSTAQNKALATTPTEELLLLPMIYEIEDALTAYQISKRGNSLRVMAEAVLWGKRGARINSISPGIVITPLAKEELAGPIGDVYRKMIALSPAGRAGTPDEVATVSALLLGENGGFITGSDFLMDGGVTAAYWFGELAP